MLSASSPITFPPSSSPPAAPKRQLSPDTTRSKIGFRAPFIIEDDEDDDDERHGDHDEPSHAGDHHRAKRRMLENDCRFEPLPPKIILERTDDAGMADASSRPQSRHRGDSAPLFSAQLFSSPMRLSGYTMTTCHGKTLTVGERKTTVAVPYESIVAARSKTKQGRAKRSYYGVDIYEITKDISESQSEPEAAPGPLRSIETPNGAAHVKPARSQLWTEKYRARTFVDLCGDDGTNRLVLRWLKKWDALVFPGMAKHRPVVARRPGPKQGDEEEKAHKKVLLLTGPPGLGKTTLAHVCARQAGYEVLEINASDDRSRNVVSNQIRTSLGTQSVKTVSHGSKGGKGPHKVARPVCVVVDEVDGVVAGSGGSGEGGFIKALVDLILVDQKKAAETSNATAENGGGSKRRNKGDDFRQMRPLILICNDVYHVSLRPLRQSNLAEIIHVGRPSMEAVVGRLRAVFEREGIRCEKDAARKICEAAWGMTESGSARRGTESTVEGDLRGIMVVGEWVAGRFRSWAQDSRVLTRQWVERHVVGDLASSAAGARGLGRGNVRDIVNRLFQEGGGFPKQALDLSKATSTAAHEQPRAELGFGEQLKKQAMARLEGMVAASGDVALILTNVLAEYPNRDFTDDCYLSKPNQAYDWLHFHDACQSRVYANQDWELAPYLCQSVLACHDLFASPRKYYAGGADRDRDARDAPPMPFTGPRADYQAHEAEKHNRAQLQALHGQLSPRLVRSFASADDIAAEFLPYLVRIVSPNVRPVLVGGSSYGPTATVSRERERVLVRRAAEVLAEVGVALHKGRIEGDGVSGRPQYVYRMDPDLDALSAFDTGASILLSSHTPTRYAVRQVLHGELQRTLALREAEARQARFKAGGPNSSAQPLPQQPQYSLDLARNSSVVDTAAPIVKRDFFGRIIQVIPLASQVQQARQRQQQVWVTFHEGLNNAVRKAITLDEFIKAL